MDIVATPVGYAAISSVSNSKRLYLTFIRVLLLSHKADNDCDRLGKQCMSQVKMKFF